LRVSKYGIEVIANSVRVFSTRGVTRPDWHVKFCQIILQKSRGSYDVGKQINKSFDFQSCLGNDCHSLRCVGCVGVLKIPRSRGIVAFNFSPRVFFGKENNSSRRVILKIELRLELNNLNSILSRSAVTPVFPHPWAART